MPVRCRRGAGAAPARCWRGADVVSERCRHLHYYTQFKTNLCILITYANIYTAGYQWCRQYSRKILERFSRDSRKILERFSRDSREILERCRRDDGAVPARSRRGAGKFPARFLKFCLSPILRVLFFVLGSIIAWPLQLWLDVQPLKLSV